MHEQPPAGLQTPDHHDVRPHRARRLHQAAGLDEVGALGYRRDLTRGHGDQLGVPAAREQGADLVADSERRHTVTQSCNLTGTLQPEDVGRAGWRLVEALPLEQVGSVHTGGLDADEHFARAGFGVGPLHDLQSVHFTGFIDDDIRLSARATAKQIIEMVVAALLATMDRPPGWVLA